jgi:hypothetical protein
VIDLHCHSTASDGTDAPATVVALAAAAGVTALALTDHDTIDGLTDAQDAAAEHDVRLVRGVELSCRVDRGSMHLLVYFLDGDHGALQDRLTELRAARERRNAEVVEVLRGHGVAITLDEVLAEGGSGSVGRPHIAAVLLRHGFVASIQDAFDRWLAKGQPAYVPRQLLEPEEAIALAHESNAVAVIAHPRTLGREGDDLNGLIAQLAASGLDGIEAEYGRYDRETRDTLHALAARHGLASTGGSDYHGAYKPDLAIGTGTGDLAVVDALLDALEARRPSTS